MNEYHGIIIREGLKEQSILDKMNVVGSKTDDEFTLFKVEIDENRLDKIITIVQQELKTDPVYYAHFYRDNELIVIFPDKIFRMTPDKSTWIAAIEHGKSLSIPEEQLDFFPCRIEDETY